MNISTVVAIDSGDQSVSDLLATLTVISAEQQNNKTTNKIIGEKISGLK